MSDVAAVLDRRDLDGAERALVKARRASSDWGRFEQALELDGRPRATRPLAGVIDEHITLSVLVGYTQATAADVLRAAGIERRRAHEQIGQAARAARS